MRRRACAARRFHRSSERPLSAAAGPVRPELRSHRRLQDCLLRRDGGGTDPVGQARRALWRREGAGDRHGIDCCRLWPRRPHRLALRRGHRASARRTGRQHAASDRLQPGVGRLLRPALANRARHLQFHWRRRQGAAAGVLRLDRRFPGLAAGADRHRRDRRPGRRHHPRNAEARAVAQQGRRGQGNGRTGPTVGLLAVVLHPHCRRPGAHRLPDLFAVPPARQRRRHPDHRSWPLAAVRGRRRGQAGDGLGRREAGRRGLGYPDRGGDDRADPPAVAAVAAARADAAAGRRPDAERHVVGALWHGARVRQSREAHARFRDLLYRRLGGRGDRAADLGIRRRCPGPADSAQHRVLHRTDDGADGMGAAAGVSLSSLPDRAHPARS